MKKIITILAVIVAWVVAGIGAYYVFVKGFNFFHTLILIVGIIFIFLAERQLKKVYVK